ncbi:hypothetical protein [Desulfurococcus mucosus]|nr:hypothetical protein [Desulfurococcus mucosus]
MTHLNELVAYMRSLVDDYERLIDQAKIIRADHDGERVRLFIAHADRVLDSSRRILPEAKTVMASGSSDVLVKHISVYYRMIKYVSIRYMVDLLEEALPSLTGNPGTLAEMQRLLAGFRELRDTL